jgi:hypothetical protein
MTWTVDASGSQTATISTEHTLDTPTTNATYVFWVDTVNLALGDTLELRCYYMIDGTNYRQVWKGSYSNVQASPGKLSPPIMGAGNQMRFTLRQTTGTGRAFPWSVLRT